MLEVEQASIGSEAKSRLDAIREEMALGPGSTSAGALGSGITQVPEAAPVEAEPATEEG
jgi:hypothetical protein